MARDVKADLEALAGMVAVVRQHDEFVPDQYGKLITLADSIILDEALSLADRLAALQLLDNAIGDGDTVTKADLHSYCYDTQG
jgi:hypothetical protein